MFKIYEHKDVTSNLWVNYHPENEAIVIWTQDNKSPYSASMVVLIKDEAKELIKALNNYIDADAEVSC